MRWSTYDAFEQAGAWPGERWNIWKQGGQDVWDRAAIVRNPGGPDAGLTISIPQFTLFMPPYHGKAMMMSSELFKPGPDGGFGVRAQMAVEIYGTDGNPFGAEPGDPRLASGAIVTVDEPSGVVLDFLVTNDRIFAVYERLAYARPKLGNYPTFTALIPAGVKTSSGAWHSYEIRYDRAKDAAEWWVDGQCVARHAPVGAPIGRSEPVVKLEALRIGGALFTLMDGGVEVDSDYGDVPPLEGLLERGANDLFGQGGQIALRDVCVSFG